MENDIKIADKSQATNRRQDDCDRGCTDRQTKTDKKDWGDGKKGGRKETGKYGKKNGTKGGGKRAGKRSGEESLDSGIEYI